MGHDWDGMHLFSLLARKRIHAFFLVFFSPRLDRTKTSISIGFYSFLFRNFIHKFIAQFFFFLYFRSYLGYLLMSNELTLVFVSSCSSLFLFCILIFLMVACVILFNCTIVHICACQRASYFYLLKSFHFVDFKL